jgi:small conductance mechanosensitive channel
MMDVEKGIRIISIILGAVLLWYLANIIGSRVISRVSNVSHRLNKQRIVTLGSLITWGIRVLIGVISIVWVLQVLSINPGPFLTGAGILGLAVSLGSQNLIRDTLNGFFIILENQYDIGDEIRIGTIQGIVEDLNLRTTKIRDETGALYILPNSTISQVANLTNKWYKISYTLNINSKESLERLERVVGYMEARLREIYEKDILDRPNIELQGFDATSLKVRITCNVKANRKKEIESVFLTFLKEGIEKENLNIL